MHASKIGKSSNSKLMLQYSVVSHSTNLSAVLDGLAQPTMLMADYQTCVEADESFDLLSRRAVRCD